MADMLSAGVQVKEHDLTTIVPSVATTEGGFAGAFAWGAVEELTLVTNENDLVAKFHKPNDTNYEDWFSAANFLGYTNALYTVRVVDSTNANTSLRATNATASGNGFLVKNNEVYNNNYTNGELKTTHNAGDWIAKFAGDLGNSLKVSVCSSASAFQSSVTGTLTVASANNTVTGDDSAFTTELTVGDWLVLNNEVHKVAAIANNNSLTLATRHILGATDAVATRRWEYFNEFAFAPGTSDYVEDKDGENDELHIVVVDAFGDWTGVKGSVLERFQGLSQAKDATLSDGSANYYVQAVNLGSKYVRWAGHDDNLTEAGKAAKNVTFVGNNTPKNFVLSGGKDGQKPDNNEYINGYALFRDKNSVDISFLIGGASTQTTALYLINSVAEYRKDVVAFISPPRQYVVNNTGSEADSVVAYRNSLVSSSYAAIDSAWKYQYDRYNDVYRYVPLNGDTAGLHARSDYEKDPWYAAAGYNRGQYKNVIKLSWNPSEQSVRDLLYKNGINPVVSEQGEGTVLMGNKTMQTKPSAFDRINVRRLFIVLEKAISKAARYSLFEFNDEFTRASFRNMVTPYLRDVKGRRGVYDFHVECSETNNTPEVIDGNEFIADIYIKPSRTAEFITLNFIATRTGVDFNTVIGKF
ncbi:tail connector/sheath protein [Ochrobactrum phage vB_OspM_OC]|nr:tail connector/sheath protein [Ochrobactrum phage vB_OspM_OC]